MSKRQYNNIFKFLNKFICILILCIVLIGAILYKNMQETDTEKLISDLNNHQSELTEANNYIQDNIKKKTNISKIGYPIDKKYSSYITSTQNLRESIKDVNSGGGATISAYHNAIDFACPEGTKIYAVNDGYIKEVYPGYYNGKKFKGHPTYGGLIVIKHEDSTTSLYAHLSETFVKEGTYVTKGQLIGKSGGVKGKRGSGNSTGPHLHFAMYIDIMNLFLQE